MWDGELIRQRAGENHGLLDRTMAFALGVSSHEIRVALSSRRWDEVHAGVYYLNVTPHTEKTVMHAAALAAGSGAVISHRTAGALWGLDGVSGKIVELTVPYSNKPMPHGVLIHRTRRPQSSTTLENIPVTSVEKTLLDLAAFLPDRVLEKAVESALRNHLTTESKIDMAVGRYGGRGVTGTRRMRRVLRLMEEESTGSAAEVETAQLIRDIPVPSPSRQFQIRMPDGRYAYPDFAWPRLMKIIEVDGLSAHSSGQQFQSDLVRQNQLMELGWAMRRFTARQVRNEPNLVRNEILRFLDPDATPNTVL